MPTSKAMKEEAPVEVIPPPIPDSVALTVQHQSAKELVRVSTDIASLCKDIVVASSIEIDGKKYVKVEGWMSLATAHGCVAASLDVEETAGGVRAIGQLRRLSDGVVLSTAEGFVGHDEPDWFGGEAERWDKRQRCYVLKKIKPRAMYAIRAMAQTRAISRVCRTAFSHVVVLMKAGLETTPADEVPRGGFRDDGSPVEEEPVKEQRQPDPAKGEASAHDGPMPTKLSPARNDQQSGGLQNSRMPMRRVDSTKPEATEGDSDELAEAKAVKTLKGTPLGNLKPAELAFLLKNADKYIESAGAKAEQAEAIIRAARIVADGDDNIPM